MNLFKKKSRGSSIDKMERRWGLLLALPAILGFLLWNFGPMIASLVLSFTEWPLAGIPKFIGISNFKKIFFDDPLFWKSLYATSYYSLGSIPLVLASAFLVAYLLNQKVKGLAIFRTVFYLPSVVPIIASSFLWMWIFSPDFGLLNLVLTNIGLPKLMWIYDEYQVIPSLILMSIWGMGNTMLIFLAGLQDVPERLYEAVDIDGGSGWHKFWYITIPMMSPVIFFNLIMGIIGTLQVFVEGFIMTEGGPNNASLFYILYLYRNAFRYGKMGYASALAWILFIIIFLLTLLVFKVSSGWVFYQGKEGK